MNSEQRVAIVTGGARRLGRAIVIDLVTHGWAVAIHCNSSRNEADTLAQEIVADGAKAVVLAADLADLSNASRGG